ncbi:flagellar basal body-associated FliL family protein [Szabonella alba]|uniref:Flagellar protein FliL n=1 Tax=Szabonella alba TaxID=2804194 RepID=A0A8K0V9T7_9RHOB|nr:flagellar basal body-associated FliL family protein [Szabonella alba]MBL4917031.1 flagellar basal body-associated FliL family protein [Szabonella alba]
MADTATAEPPPVAKRRRLPLLIGLLAALIAGGAGFYATWSGLIGGSGTAAEATPPPRPIADLAFVPVDPIVVSLGQSARSKHLRFTAQLEVNRSAEADVALLMPRILDVVNGYLRAVDVARLEDPAALVVLRAQMLRRIQLVTGEGRVRDLLITEFVLN